MFAFASAAPQLGRRSQTSGPRGAHEKDRTRHRAGQGLEQVEQARLGPVDVLDERDDRALARDRLEVPLPGCSDGPSGHSRLEVRERIRSEPDPDGRQEHLRGAERLVGPDEALVQAAGRLRCDRLGRVAVEDPGLGLEDLGHRPVGDSVAVRKAPSPDHPRVWHRAGELVRQAALADPWRAHEGHQRRSPRPDGSVEQRAQEDELAVPPDHHRSQVARLDARLGVGNDLPDRDRTVDALQRRLAQVAIGERSTGHPSSPIRDDDRACRGQRLDPGGQADRVTGHGAAAVRGGASQHVAGIHPDPHREAPVGPVREPAIADQTGLHRQRCPDRSLGIVLMGDGVAEDRDDRIADVLLHGPAVAGDLVGHRLEERSEDRPELLGVELRGKLGRRHEIGVQDGDDLALLGRALKSRLDAVWR